MVKTAFPSMIIKIVIRFEGFKLNMNIEFQKNVNSRITCNSITNVTEYSQIYGYISGK